MKRNDVNICLKRHGCMNYDLLTCMGFFHHGYKTCKYKGITVRWHLDD